MGGGRPPWGGVCLECRQSPTAVCLACCSCTSVSYCQKCYDRHIRKIRSSTAQQQFLPCLCTPKRKPCQACTSATGPLRPRHSGVTETARFIFVCIPLSPPPFSPFVAAVKDHPLLVVQLLLDHQLVTLRSALVVSVTCRGSVDGRSAKVSARRLKSEECPVTAGLSVAHTFVLPPWCENVQVSVVSSSSAVLRVPARLMFVREPVVLRMSTSTVDDWISRECSFNLTNFWRLRVSDVIAEDGAHMEVHTFYCRHRHVRCGSAKDICVRGVCILFYLCAPPIVFLPGYVLSGCSVPPFCILNRVFFLYTFHPQVLQLCVSGTSA